MIEIIPAIDLQNRQCVRLYQGDFSQVSTYKVDPFDIAKSYLAEGAKTLHIVDLDGAKQQSCVQTDLIIDIAKSSQMAIQTGGGIRTETQVRTLLEAGIQRIVIGSLCVKNPEQVIQWLHSYGAERFTLALDIKMNNDGVPMLATHGWQANSNTSLWELLEYYPKHLVKHVLCTDIAKDGTLQGPNIDLYQQAKQRFPDIAWQASGGIGSLNDLRNLADINIDAVIIGKALYENVFTLSEAFNEVTAYAC